MIVEILRRIYKDWRYINYLKLHGGVDPCGNIHSDYAALLARHNALREAVEWERECEECLHWIQIQFAEIMYLDGPLCDLDEISDLYDSARAEVDRLLGENQS